MCAILRDILNELFVRAQGHVMWPGMWVRTAPLVLSDAKLFVASAAEKGASELAGEIICAFNANILLHAQTGAFGGREFLYNLSFAKLS